jgi:hypothetical protein
VALPECRRGIHLAECGRPATGDLGVTNGRTKDRDTDEEARIQSSAILQRI